MDTEFKRHWFQVEYRDYRGKWRQRGTSRYLHRADAEEATRGETFYGLRIVEITEQGIRTHSSLVEGQ